MENRFTAVYHVNKYNDGNGEFDYELLGIQCLFESRYEEDFVIGEHTDTYYHVTHALLDKAEGVYRVFVSGYLEYTKDYYGECDVTSYVGYTSVEFSEINSVGDFIILD